MSKKGKKKKIKKIKKKALYLVLKWQQDGVLKSETNSSS